MRSTFLALLAVSILTVAALTPGASTPVFAANPSSASVGSAGSAGGDTEGKSPVAGENDGLISGNIEGCDFVTGRLHAMCVPIYIGYLISWIFRFVGIIFLIVTMVGGYQYVLGTVNIGTKEQGIARIKFGVIGMMVSALSYFIIDFIISAIAPI